MRRTLYEQREFSSDVIYIKEGDVLVPAVTLKVVSEIAGLSLGSISLYTKNESNPLPVKKVLGVNLVTLKDLLSYKWVRRSRGTLAYVTHLHYDNGVFTYHPCKACTDRENIGALSTGECNASKGQITVGNKWVITNEQNKTIE